MGKGTFRLSLKLMARIQKFLAKDSNQPTGAIKIPDENFTRNEEETLSLLSETYLPDSAAVTSSDNPPNPSTPCFRATREDWELARTVVICRGIKRAIGNVDSLKSLGPDEMIPALL